MIIIIIIIIKLTYPINKYYIHLVGKYAFSLANLFSHQSLTHWQKNSKKGSLIFILSVIVACFCKATEVNTRPKLLCCLG